MRIFQSPLRMVNGIENQSEKNFLNAGKVLRANEWGKIETQKDLTCKSLPNNDTKFERTNG